MSALVNGSLTVLLLLAGVYLSMRCIVSSISAMRFGAKSGAWPAGSSAPAAQPCFCS